MEEAHEIATLIVRDVAELIDRTSPDDWPEAMLVTGAELREIVMKHLPVGVAGPGPAPADAAKLAEAIRIVATTPARCPACVPTNTRTDEGDWLAVVIDLAAHHRWTYDRVLDWALAQTAGTEAASADAAPPTPDARVAGLVDALGDYIGKLDIRASGLRTEAYAANSAYAMMRAARADTYDRVIEELRAALAAARGLTP